MTDHYLLLGIVFAPIVGYLGKKYAYSGNIKHSTAADLWRESQEIRKLLAEEVKSLRIELKEAKECCEKYRTKVR